eukprot:5518891-Prymnesium_polylepis.1
MCIRDRLTLASASALVTTGCGRVPFRGPAPVRAAAPVLTVVQSGGDYSVNSGAWPAEEPRAPRPRPA